MRFPTLIEPAIRRYVGWLVAFFVLTAVLGWLAPERAMAPVIDRLRPLMLALRSLPTWQLFLVILANNAIKTFFAMMGGVLLGILPTVAIASNGFLLGALCHRASHLMRPLQLVGALVPHGMFELPAVFIAAGYGLWIGAGVLERMGGQEGVDIAGRVRHAVRRYLQIVLPLLIVAAAIESTLSRWARSAG